jgi:hypothetical protein
MWHQALDSHNSIKQVCRLEQSVLSRRPFDRLKKKRLHALDIHLLLKWMHSFLSYRQQHVKDGNILSGWITLRKGMSQRTWLGSYVNTILTDDLSTILVSFKLVDDLILTVIIDQSHTSRAQFAADRVYLSGLI